MHDDENFIYLAGNKSINLTPVENIVLKLLIQYKNKKILSYKEVNTKIHMSENYMNQTISRLRKKFKGEFKIYNRKKIGYFII